MSRTHATEEPRAVCCQRGRPSASVPWDAGAPSARQVWPGEGVGMLPPARCSWGLVQGVTRWGQVGHSRGLAMGAEVPTRDT